jgi:hypothetical protein
MIYKYKPFGAFALPGIQSSPGLMKLKQKGKVSDIMEKRSNICLRRINYTG